MVGGPGKQGANPGQWRDDFLREFAGDQNHMPTISAAAKAVGVTWQAVDQARKGDPEGFGAAVSALVSERKQRIAESLRSVMARRAIDGDPYLYQGEVIEGVFVYDTGLQKHMANVYDEDARSLILRARDQDSESSAEQMAIAAARFLQEMRARNSGDGPADADGDDDSDRPDPVA